MQAQDPLNEFDLRDGTIRKPTYISSKVDPSLKIQMAELLKEFKDCFAWDYDEMTWLNQDLVELKLLISTRQETSEADSKKVCTRSDVGDQRRNRKAYKEQTHKNYKPCQTVSKYSSYYSNEWDS